MLAREHEHFKLCEWRFLMSDENQNGQTVAEDQLVTDSQELQSEAPLEPMPSSEEPADNQVETSERTKEQFQKLLEHNRELAEKVKALEGSKPQRMSVVEASDPMANLPTVPQGQVTTQPLQNLPNFDFSHLSQRQVEKEAVKFVDSDGYLDEAALNNHLSQLNTKVIESEERARRAEERLQQVDKRISTFEQNQEAKELHIAFPELDPNSPSFNEDFYDLTRKEILDQRIRVGTVNAMEAARKMSKHFRKPQVDQQAVAQRQQATAQVGTITSQSSSTTQETDQLRREARNNSEALGKLLMSQGF